MLNKLLSIIILTYNSENDIKDCLDSLIENFDSKRAEIIIWDNNSQDKTKEILKTYEKFEFIKIIFNDKNIGFAEGNDQASKYAVGKYLLLLNADTISDYKVYEELADYLEKNNNVGVIGPKCIDELGIIQESYGDEPGLLKEIRGKILMSLYLEKISIIRKLKESLLDKKTPIEVGWVGGACAMIRKELWDKIGGLDKAYFFSNGDMIDLCFKIRKLGYKCVYYPNVSIIHKGSRAVTRDLKTRIMGLKKGYLGTLYFFQKHHKSIFYIYLTKLVFILISLFKGILALMLSIFKKRFKDLALSHLIVDWYLTVNFFDNDFLKQCQK